MRSEIDTFSFRDLESTINDTAINNIEAEIADLNEHRYKLDYELQEIDRSLNSEIKFDIEKIAEIFSETGVVFPQVLVRSYEELLDFNRQLSSGRTIRLKNLRQKLILQRQVIMDRIQDLDRRRQAAFEVLRQQETFEKYRALQRTLSGYEQELYQLQQQLIQLNQAANLQKEIEDKSQEATEAINEIRQSVRGVNEIYTAIRTTFSAYVERVLNVQALLSVIINLETSNLMCEHWIGIFLVGKQVKPKGLPIKKY